MEDKEILNMEEAAELFGVSIKTFIKLLKEEAVPARKIGREWRFSKKALMDWLALGNSMDYSSSEIETRDFFDKIAPQWESISGSFHDESVRDRIVNDDILKKHMTLVDLGAGDGYISRTCAGFVKTVIAVDISQGMLNELEKKASIEGIENIETVLGDGQDLQTEDSTVDLVCANMYLHHIEEPQIAIKEMYRVLKPGGRVYLADFLRHKNKKLVDEQYDLWPGFSLTEIKEWFENIGFVNINIDTLENLKNKKANVRTNERVFILTAEKNGGKHG